MRSSSHWNEGEMPKSGKDNGDNKSSSLRRYLEERQEEAAESYAWHHQDDKTTEAERQVRPRDYLLTKMLLDGDDLVHEGQETSDDKYYNYNSRSK